MPLFLVIQLARFGDILQSKRLIKSLQQNGRVDLCVDQSLAALAALVYPDCRILSLPCHGADSASVLLGSRAVLDEWSQTIYDSVYVLNHAGLAQALTRVFAPEQMRGYLSKNGQSLRSNWLRLAFRWMGKRRLASLNLMDFWAWLCEQPLDPALVNPPAQAGGRGLGVVLAGQVARRSLPVEVLAPLIRAVASRLDNPTITLLGSAKEERLGRELIALLPMNMRGQVRNLAGQTDWAGLIEALQGLDLLLSPDTGTAHLAAHLGVPVQAFFLSSAWAFETAPYGLGHRIWQSASFCAPCLESAPCQQQTVCVKAFQQPAFLSTLTGKAKPLPADLVELSTGFDQIGQILHGWPEDLEQANRLQLRQLLGEYLGVVPIQAKALPDLYLETDWVLPQYRP